MDGTKKLEYPSLISVIFFMDYGHYVDNEMIENTKMNHVIITSRLYSFHKPCYFIFGLLWFVLLNIFHLKHKFL